jgi:hypothetical protein
VSRSCVDWCGHVPKRARGTTRVVPRWRSIERVVAVLTMMLGLGLAGSGLVSPAPLPQEAVQGSYPPARTVLLGTAASSLAVGGSFSSDPACHLGHPLASRPGGVVPAWSDDDLRQYLRQMAALRYRRRVSTATTLDPYQGHSTRRSISRAMRHRSPVTAAPRASHTTSNAGSRDAPAWWYEHRPY